MNGNYNSDPATQFIGTLDNKDISFRTNNLERFRIKSGGKISMSTFSGSGSKIVYADSLGVLRSFSFLLSTCLPQSPIIAWQANPTTPEKVFACGIDFGIGTDSPREKLEVKGTVLVTSWDNSLSNMTDYLQLKHDGVNSRIESFGAGDLLLNNGNPRNVKVNLGSGSGYFETGNNTYLATESGNVGIGTYTSQAALQIGDRFTFHNGNNKVIGYNYYSDGTYDKKLVTDETAVLFFQSDGGISFRTSPVGNQGDNISWTEAMNINNIGDVGIGSLPEPNFKLAVCGGIFTDRVKVVSSWCDFVFADDYDLKPLSEVKSFIERNKHLPEIPSESEIAENGLDLGEMSKLQMQKIEELYLHIIKQEEMINELMNILKENNLLK